MIFITHGHGSVAALPKYRVGQKVSLTIVVINLYTRFYKVV